MGGVLCRLWVCVCPSDAGAVWGVHDRVCTLQAKGLHARQCQAEGREAGTTAPRLQRTG
jgi:hypothetical protein